MGREYGEYILHCPGCSSSRWKYHFPLYVLRADIGFYWLLELIWVHTENIDSVWEKFIRSKRGSSICTENIPSRSGVRRPPPHRLCYRGLGHIPVRYLDQRPRPPLARAAAEGEIPSLPPRSDRSSWVCVWGLAERSCSDVALLHRSDLPPPWSGNGANRHPPGLLMFIVDWFASLITDLLLAPTDLVPSLLMSSLLFYYQIFLWFSKDFFQLISTNDRPLINSQWPWSSTVYSQLICIADPISIDPTEPVPGLLLSSLVVCYQIFLWF